MEYLENDGLYRLLEDPQKDNFTITMEIKRLLKEDPDVVHRTLNHISNQAEMYKAEKLRVAKIQKEKEENVDFIKKVVTEELQKSKLNSGKAYIDTSIGKLSIKKSPGKVKIINLDAIPEEFFKVEKTPKLTELKKAYEDGTLANNIIEIEQSYSLIQK